MQNEKLWFGKTILIVDDSKVIQQHLSSVYSSLGLKVIEIASDGVAAVEIFKNRKPDIVSLDIIMPEMHGIDCYRCLKEIDPDFKFMFVSCLAEDAANSEFFHDEIPVGHFISKPATQESVERSLSFILGEGASSEAAPLLESASPGARTPAA